MAVSPKVSSATVGASVTTMIIGIIGPHVFPHGMAPDVQGLIGAAVTAGVTFASGWFAREATKVEPEVKAAERVFTKIQESAGPVAKAIEAAVPDAAPAPSVNQPVAQPIQ